MKLVHWLTGMDYRLVMGTASREVSEVVYDSRKADKDCVFVCMKGTKTDSHDFILDTVEKGTRVFIVEKDISLTGLPEDTTVLQVESSREALAYLSAARFGYPAKKMITIGVTGTKGKTTTTHMIKSILESAGKKVGMIGTTGVVIGGKTFPTVNTTPESYMLQSYFAKMVEEGCEYMIMEVSSQGVKMHRIDGICFDYGIFTNISPDHIGPDEHESFEEYLFYKSQILSRSKTGIVNRDDEHYETIIKAASEDLKLYTFGMGSDGDYRATNIEYVSEHDFVGLDFLAEGLCPMKVQVGIPGRFNVSNALAALSVCHLLNIPDESIRTGLFHAKVNGRMEIVYASKRCSVIVDYAHNAVSMESLLKTLRDYHPKRLVCVFGCGGNRSKDRRYSMGEIGGRLADFCILTADNSRFEKVEDILADIRSSINRTNGSYIEIPDRREAIEYSISHAQPGDMIAVIGKGHEDYQEIEGIRYPFLDRSVILEVVSRLEQEASEQK